MRTRTAPSDLPRTPAISAVDISSTKRRTTARRRSAGRRPTARHAAAASSRVAAPPSTSSGSATSAAASSGACGWRRRAAALVGDDVAGDLEQPDAERRGALAVGRPGPLLEPVEVGEGGEERPLRGVLGLVMVAELVVRVAVHLGEVPAIEGVELGADRGGPPRRATGRDRDGRPRGGRASSDGAHPSKHRTGHPLHPPARGGRGWISPTGPGAGRRSLSGSSTTSAPVIGVDAAGPGRPRSLPSRSVEPDERGRS